MYSNGHSWDLKHSSVDASLFIEYHSPTHSPRERWCRCSDNSCYPSRFPTYRLCACADSQFFFLLLFFFLFFTKGTFSCYNG